MAYPVQTAIINKSNQHIMTTTTNQIHQALNRFNPSHLELINESAAHAGYFEGKESHFKLVIVSEQFDGLRLAARHQQIYTAVQSLLTGAGGSIHALAIFAYTPKEWAEQSSAPASPDCQGKNKA